MVGVPFAAEGFLLLLHDLLVSLECPVLALLDFDLQFRLPQFFEFIEIDIHSSCLIVTTDIEPGQVPI